MKKKLLIIILTGKAGFGLAQTPTNYIQQYGNVGIGTTLPVGALHVVDATGTASTADNILRLETTGGAVGPSMRFKSFEGADYLLTATGSNNDGGAGHFRIYDYAAFRTRFFIQAGTGNVGIGTTVPNAALELGSGGSLRLSGGSGSGQGNIQLGAAASSAYDGNLVYLADNSMTTGILASSTPAFSSTNGPYVALRGNGYTAIGSQRGVLALSAGNPSNPNNAEGIIKFLTGADQARMVIANNGNIGMGTVTPAYALDIASPTLGLRVKSTDASTIAITYLENNSGYTGQFFKAGSGYSTYKNIFAQDLGFYNSGHAGNIAILNDYPSGNINFAAGGASAAQMTLAPSGNVGIGTANVGDANYKLFVETGIRTRKVRVDQTNWPDYVFKPAYPLPTLSEVEAYVKQRNHLPDVPSAEDVEKKGLDVGENQAVLLRKIEELTLYLIELKKQVEQQRQQIKALQQKGAAH